MGDVILNFYLMQVCIVPKLFDVDSQTVLLDHGGMFTGGLMGGGSKVASASVQQLQNYKTGKNILSTDGGVDALLYSADQVRGLSPIQTQNALINEI